MKKSTAKRALSAAMALALAFCLVKPVQAVYEDRPEDSEESEEYVIRVSDEEAMEELEEQYDVEQMDSAELIATAELTGAEAEHLETDDGISAVEEDVTFTASDDGVGTSDTEINQWYLDAIGAAGEDSGTVSGRPVRVALIDSGISYTGSVEPEESINYVDVEEECNPLFLDSTSHGTAIANILCSDGSNGLEGIDPEIELYSAKVLDGNNQAPLSRVVEGIYWAISQDVDIINLSLGTTTDSAILHQAVQDAWDQGILIIAAAGNTAGSAVQYPAAYDEVMAVGSVDETGTVSENCAEGAQLEILAPGEKIMSTGFIDIPLVTGGTSIAAAQVTGIAALLWQKDTAKSNVFIRELLDASVMNVEGSAVGAVDYEYASDIYDIFAAAYTENGSTAEEEDFSSTKTMNDYSEDADSVAGALWNSAGHEEIVQNCTESQETEKYQIIYEYSTVADKCFPSDESTNSNYIMRIPCLHGRPNYVETLKYLWYFAQALGRSGEITTVTEMNDAIIAARNQAKAQLADDSWYIRKYNATDTELALPDNISALKNLIINSGTMVKTGKNASGTYERQPGVVLSAKTMKYRVMGYMLHVIGDVYSHQTIVPGEDTVIQFANVKTEEQTFYQDNMTAGTLRFIRLLKCMNTPAGLEDWNWNTDCIDNTAYFSDRFECAKDRAQNIYHAVSTAFDWTQYVCPVRENVKIYRLKSMVESCNYSFDDSYDEYSSGSEQ